MRTGSRKEFQWRREDRLPTLEELAWLQSPEGESACAAMLDGSPADTPAAISRWRQQLDSERVAAAWKQALLRRTAAAKFSRAESMLFDRVALEQASDEVVANYKAQRFARLGRVADFCCGIGGDALALAAGREVVAVDCLEVRLAMARHNADVYDRKIETVSGDAAFERPSADAAHVDPDRRSKGRRSHDADAGSPNLQQLQRIVSHYGNVAIKFSPGMEPEKLPFEAEIELISHHGQCKQAVAWTGSLRHAHRRATALPSGETIAVKSGESLDWPSAEPPRPDRFLFEPDPAVIRANLVGPLASRLQLAPIDPLIAYLTGEKMPETDLLRAFRIVDTLPWSLREVRTWLARHDVGQVEIKTRGFAARPEEILPRLKLSGREQATLFLTRRGTRPTAILARRIHPHCSTGGLECLI